MKKTLLVLSAILALSLAFVGCKKSTGDNNGDSDPVNGGNTEQQEVQAEVFESNQQWAELSFDTTGLKSITVVFAEAPKNLQFKVVKPEGYQDITTTEATCVNPDGNVEIRLQHKTTDADTIKIIKVTGKKADDTEVALTVDVARTGSWGWTKK